MRYDLEVEITPGGAPGVYAVAVDSPAGAAVGTARLDAAVLLGRRRELAASVLASAVTTRSGLSSVLERPVREVGQALFEGVFADRIYGRYTASVQEATRRGAPLRVVLRLRAPELAGLPWETLFDPEAGEYLCQREPVVRYVETAQPATPLAVEPPLRILGLVAAPHNLPRLDVAEERRRLTEAVAELAGSRRVELVWAPGGSWPVLQDQLQAGPWHVLHFVGHGGTDPSGGEGLLVLEDEVGAQAAAVSATRFARLLHACRPVPRLVVLNSCQSGEAAADDLLSSTAAALVHSGISAAVAMQFAVTDPAALAFARGFYRALARNQPVDEAVRLGRIAIDGTGEQTLEWVTPVVYLRTDDTRLFSLTAPHAGPEQAAEQPSSPQVAQEATLYGLYVQALAALRTDRHDQAIALLDSLLTLDPTYRDAAARRDAARQASRLTTGYQRARAAEDAGDWTAAIRHYIEVIAVDPAYRDAAERRDACRHRQQIASLQDELRLHASTQDWPAVLAASEHLAALEPTQADPGGLATTAREQLRRRQEAERAAAQREQEIGRLRDRLRASAQAQDWPAVLSVSKQLAVLDPRHADPDGLATTAREQLRRRQEAERAAAERQREITQLRDRLKASAKAQNWPAVLAVSEQLAALDASQADPDGLATRARKQLRRRQEAERVAAEQHEKASPVRKQLQARADAHRNADQQAGAQQAEQGAAQRADRPHRKTLRKSRRSLIVTLIGFATVVVLTLVVLTLKLGTRTAGEPTIGRPTPGQPVPTTISRSARRTLTGHTGGVDAVAVTPDGRQVVSGSEDNTVRVWDLASGQATSQLQTTLTGNTGWVHAVVVTPDGRQVVGGCNDFTVRVWDLASGRLIRTLTGHTLAVEAVAVTPDGRQVVSGSGDETVRVWDLASGQLVRTLTSHTDIVDVDAVAVTPDGRQVVSGSGDNTVRVWDLASS